MGKFIWAKREDEKELYINIDLACEIQKTDTGYDLNIFGNKYTVCTEYGKNIIQSLLDKK